MTVTAAIIVPITKLPGQLLAGDTVLQLLYDNGYLPQ
jgi:hypothetical protein